jgi:hypothetical protein
MSEIIYSNIQSKPADICFCCKDGGELWSWASGDEAGPELEANCNSAGGTTICAADGSPSPC